LNSDFYYFYKSNQNEAVQVKQLLLFLLTHGNVRLMKNLCFIVLFILLFAPGFAQDSTVYRIHGKGHLGFIWAHRDYMSHLVKGHPVFFELSLTKDATGKHEWEHLHLFPETGISAIFIDFANKEQLGHALTIFPHIGFPLRKGEFLKLNFRMGMGIAYLTKKFDRIENRKNHAIASNLNATASFQLENYFHLNNRLQLRTGIALTHFSNGSYKMPNLGINMFTANTGFTYALENPQSKPKRIKPRKPFKSADLTMISTAGIKSFHVLGEQYPVYTLRFSGEKSFTPKSALAAGFDLVYNSALKGIKPYYHGTEVQNKSELMQPGVNLGYSFNIEKLSLFVQKGIYAANMDNHTGRFYHRIGCRYRFNNRLIANFSLKSHFGVADHFEYGIGYSFTK
jgi:hypothetical protein